MQVVQRGLSVAVDVTYNTLEDGWLVRVGAYVGIEVLQLDLLAAKVLWEAAEAGCAVLVAILVLKLMALDAFAHEFGLFL